MKPILLITAVALMAFGEQDLPKGPRNADRNVQLANGTWLNPGLYQCAQQISGTISSTTPCSLRGAQ